MKPIEGYEGLYFACPTGRIWATEKGRWKERYLCPWLIGRGYETVMLYKNATPTKFLVHRLIAQTFIPNPDSLPEVNHIDGNKRNNRPENLEWVSSKQNKMHAWANGVYWHKGEKHYKTHITEKIVKEIRKLHSFGMSYAKIGEEVGCSRQTARNVVVGVSWSHIL